MADYGSLPFEEAIAFFQQKLDLPTARWDDLLGAAHDRAFVVAGAMQADLLADLRAAVTKGIAQGTTLAEFRRDFESLVAKSGWTGWTGEGSAAGRAWRTEVIYSTNLRTSHAAGRYAQLQEIRRARPYWRYVHNDTVAHPRPQHLAWHGRIIPADDPWWQTHYPPNGWGCRCQVESLAPRDLARLGVDPKTLTAPSAPDDLTGIDRGWGYAPGASVASGVNTLLREKVGSLARREAGAELAKTYVASLLASDLFTRFVAGTLGGEYPVAALDAGLRQTLATEQPVVLLSRVTIDGHRHHPEIGAAEYRLAQRILDEGELYEQSPGRLLALWRQGETLYRAAL